MKSEQKNSTDTTSWLQKIFPKLLLVGLLFISFTLGRNLAKDPKVEETTVGDESIVKDETIVEDENVVYIPEDFPAFYAKFHVDPEFQLSHVQFPLPGKSENEKWEAMDWVIHQPFSNTSEFKRDIENVAGIITETIMDNNGMFYIVRRFAKLGEEWMLIFYTQGTNLDGFVPEENQSDQ